MNSMMNRTNFEDVNNALLQAVAAQVQGVSAQTQLYLDVPLHVFTPTSTEGRRTDDLQKRCLPPTVDMVLHTDGCVDVCVVLLQRHSPKELDSIRSFFLPGELLEMPLPLSTEDVEDTASRICRVWADARESGAARGLLLPAENANFPQALLERTHMRNAYGSTSPFGRYCGLFFRYDSAGDDSFERVPAVADRGAVAAQILPGVKMQPEEARLIANLKKVPLEELVCNNALYNDLMEDISMLQTAIAHVRFAREIRTLGDVMNLVCDAMGYAEREQNMSLHPCMNNILFRLDSVLALANHVFGLEALDLPAVRFFELAALESGCSYPLYSFRCHIEPRMHGCETLRDLLSRVDTFSMLFQLLAEPLYTNEYLD